jgi:hypothetical protein
MRWAAFIWAIAGCGGGVGGNGGGGSGEPMSAVFIFNGDRFGDTVLQGQVAAPGLVGLAEGGGCTNPAPDAPLSLARFLPPSSADLRDIGDVALDGFEGLVIARPIDDTNLNYALIRDDVPYPTAGTEVSVRAEDHRFHATLVIGDAPTVTAPADRSTFMRTDDLPMTVAAPDAAGIVVDMDFSNDSRAVCFFDHDGDIVIPREAITCETPGADPACNTFALSGDVEVLVGSWTIGEGGTGDFDVHLVSISTTAISLSLQGG